MSLVWVDFEQPSPCCLPIQQCFGHVGSFSLLGVPQTTRPESPAMPHLITGEQFGDRFLTNEGIQNACIYPESTQNLGSAPSREDSGNVIGTTKSIPKRSSPCSDKSKSIAPIKANLPDSGEALETAERPHALATHPLHRPLPRLGYFLRRHRSRQT